MTASQSLAQPFGERSDGDARRRRRVRGRLRVDGLARAERARRALRARRAPPCSRPPTSSSSSRRTSPARCGRGRPSRSASSSPTSRARSTPAALKGAQVALEQSGYRVMLMDCGQSRGRRGRSAPDAARATGSTACSLSTVGIELRRFDDVVGRAASRASSSTAPSPDAGDGTVAARQRRRDRPARRPHGRARPPSGSGCSPARRSETSGRERLDAFRAALRSGTGSTLTPRTSAASAGRARTGTAPPARCSPREPRADRDRLLERRARARRDARLPRARASHPRRRRPRHLRRRVLRRARSTRR